MPELGSHYAAYRGVGRYSDGVGVNAEALEITIERPARTHRGQPQAETKGANGKVSDVNEGIHGVRLYLV
jgi:hypothetical protein